MPEYIYALAMVLMEMLFLFVMLLAFYHQRKVIGDNAFLMLLALLFTFDRWIAAADIRVVLWNDVTFRVGEVAVGLPALAAFLLVYIMQGVLAAQRVLLGMVTAFFIYIYMGQITRLQCEWDGFSLFPGLYGGALEALLSSGRATVNLLAVSHFCELLCLPVSYKFWGSIGLSRRWAVFLAMPCALLAGLLPSIASGTVAGEGFGAVFNGDFYARMCGITILALLLNIYIERFEHEIPDSSRRVFDFFFAFFGSYGRLQETEKNLQEWQSRFHAVFDNATEVIVTFDEKGFLVDANIVARKLFKLTGIGKSNGAHLGKLLKTSDGSPFILPKKKQLPWHGDCIAGDRILQSSIFPVKIQRQQLLVMNGRDVTQEREFAREKAQLTEQLNHSQRLESLGILAGGIAHDFNNCIHAILGYVDVAMIFGKNDPETVQKHLEKIGKVAEQAGKLTGQMLGFARRGKYHVVDIVLSELFEQCRMLIAPQKLSDIEFTVTLPAPEFRISADMFQIQQVLINMLLNAVDALNGVKDARLELFALPAAESPVAFSPPPGDLENADVSEYLAIIIRDNGCGMSPEVSSRIFEPFFTTKPVGHGTGMGLSMAYGIIANHKGWIQLESAPGKGTAFAIFMKRLVPQGE